MLELLLAALLGQQPAAPPASPALDYEFYKARVEPLFLEKREGHARCVTCHGANGAGDGPASVGLTPRPRDFRDPAWQAKVTDAHIEEIIAKGGAAVGLSPLMPPQPDLSAAQREALRLHVRGFQR